MLKVPGKFSPVCRDDRSPKVTGRFILPRPVPIWQERLEKLKALALEVSFSARSALLRIYLMASNHFCWGLQEVVRRWVSCQWKLERRNATTVKIDYVEFSLF